MGKVTEKDDSNNDDSNINSIQDGPFRGCSRMGVGEKDPPSLNLSHISDNDETWHSYTLSAPDISILQQKSVVFVISGNITWIYCICGHVTRVS